MSLILQEVQGPDVNYYELLDIVSGSVKHESVNLTIGPETVDCGSLGLSARWGR